MFSRHRRVAQWLERLLDTQEVGGSSPLVPTIRLRRSRERQLGWQAARQVDALSELAGESKGRSIRKRLPVFPMSEISVTLPDGSSRRVPAGATARRRGGRDLSAPRQGRARGGRRRPPGRSDLSAARRTRRSAIVTADSPEALALYRHSTAHLLAAAVTNLFPGTQCGIGPATDEGFFYDFVVDGRSCRRTSRRSRRR